MGSLIRHARLNTIKIIIESFDKIHSDSGLKMDIQKLSSSLLVLSESDYHAKSENNVFLQ